MRRWGTICGLFPCVYAPWLPKILHMANRAELTLDPLRLVARSSLRSLDHVGRFSFLVVDLLRGLAEWRIWVVRMLEQAVAVGYGSLFIVLVVPALTMLANATGIVVGYMVAKGSLGLTYGDFEYGARYFFRPLDLWYSLIKSYCFAAAVTLIPCYIGFNTQQGAEGVGRATTTAVVSASVAILLLDALTTRLLLVAK